MKMIEVREKPKSRLTEILINFIQSDSLEALSLDPILQDLGMEGGPEDVPLPATLRALPRSLRAVRAGRRGDVRGGAEDGPGIDQRHWGSLHLQVRIVKQQGGPTVL